MIKPTLRAHIDVLNALLPLDRTALKAAMTLVPVEYRDYLADKLLGVA